MTFGKENVLNLLQLYLKNAKENPYGEFGHIVISMVGHPNIAAADLDGDVRLMKGQLESLAKITAKLQTMVDSVAFPEQDASLDASYHCSSLCVGPMGYDFITWLVDAELTRVREGAPKPLKVGFWHGRPDLINPYNTIEARQRWLDNLFRPALKLLGAVEDERAIHGRQKELWVPRDIVKAVRAGEKVPRFHSSAQIPPSMRGAVTITLREASHWPHRNSNVEAWYRVASDLKRRGERVVFVRDTCKAWEPVVGFDTCPDASLNLETRCSLYEHAKANLFISNGPFGIACYGDRPYLCFVPIEDEDTQGGYEPATAKFWRASTEIGPGEQWPWAQPDQRLVWKPDTYENIAEAWEALTADTIRNRLTA